MKWNHEQRKITELKGHARNPRRLSKHDAEHLQKSLENFGQCEPVVINADNTIIGGHQRVSVLKRMKRKVVDVYVPQEPLSNQQVDELNIRLNRNSGEWDFDVLANGWDPGDLIDWGFTEGDLDIDVDVINEADQGNAKDVDDESDVDCALLKKLAASDVTLGKLCDEAEVSADTLRAACLHIVRQNKNT